MTFAYQYDSRIALCLSIVPFRCWQRQQHVCNWRKRPNTAQRADVTPFFAAAFSVVDFISRTSFFLKFAWIFFSPFWIVYYASFHWLWIVVTAFHRFVYLLTRLHYTWARTSLYYYERAGALDHLVYCCC